MRSNWRTIENIFLEFPHYNCFCCSPSHSWGFRLEFYHDPDEGVVVSPLAGARQEMAGFPGVLHGGFQAMLLDEIMCWAAIHFKQKMVMTAKMEVKHQRTVHTGAELLLKGRVGKAGSRLIEAEGWIEEEGQLLARATGSYVIPRVGEFMESLGLKELPDTFLSYLRS